MLALQRSMNLCRASLPRFEEVLGSAAAASEDEQKKQKLDAEKFEGPDEMNGKKDKGFDAEKFKGPDERNGKKDEEARRTPRRTWERD